MLYVVMAYAIPWGLIYTAGYPWLYREPELNIGALAVLIFTYLSSILIGNINMINKKNRKIFRYKFQFVNDNVQVSILILCVLVAGFGLALGFNDFRYEATSISGRGSFLLIIFAMIPTILQFFLLVYLFYEPIYYNKFKRRSIFKRILLAVGLIISSNGIATLMVASIAVMHAIFPYTLRDFLLKNINNKKSNNNFNLIKFFIIGAVLIFLVGISWVAGEATKRGDLFSVIDLIKSDDSWRFALEWLNLRLSPSYVSLLNALDYYSLSTDPSVIINNLFAPLKSFLFRLNHLLMSPIEFLRPDDGTIARINYLFITESEFVRSKEGTSPGLFSGFLYSFPFPMNFIILFGYLMLIQNILSRIIGGMLSKMTSIGWVCFLIFTLALFASPIDFLLIVDDGMIALILLMLLCYSCIKKSYIV